MGSLPAVSLPMILALALVSSAAAAAPPRAPAAAGEDGQWTMPGRDYASTRFSPLAQINSGNAAALHTASTYSTGVLAGGAGHPLVVPDTMYVIAPWPNVLYAF